MGAPGFIVATVLALLVTGSTGWRTAAPLFDQRSEVAAAAYAGGIAVAGGYAIGCSASKRVDLYLPAKNRWRRLRDLPLALHHAAAASHAGRLYVVGGAGKAPNYFPRPAFVHVKGRWKRLRPLPDPRIAAGAAIVGGKLYVVGGIETRGLAARMFVLDLATGQWSTMPGPTPREHLAVVAARGNVYAIGGRLGGPDANVDLVEAFTPETGEWERLAPVPEPRGGTGAAVVGGMIVSVGGETSQTTLRAVYAYDLDAGTWQRLPDLKTPRHGMAVASHRNRVYAIGGSPVADCGFSAANQYLEVSP